MQAWEANQGTRKSFITMMGDPAREFTSALGMEMNHEGPPSVGIINRSKRFALHVNDGKVAHVEVSEADDDPAGDANSENTCAPAMLKAVKAPVDA